MSINSFANYSYSGGNQRSSGRLTVRPYFGHFSGLWITFDIRKSTNSAGNQKVKIKIEGCRCPSPIYLRTHQPVLDLSKPDAQLQLKEICLQYAHAADVPQIQLQKNPRSLSFLCEKQILLNLNKVNSAILPQVSFSHLNPETFESQDVIIKIWFGSSSFPTRIERMKVKQGLSIAELKWMLCSKLSNLVTLSPLKLDIYDYRSMEKISDTTYLVPHQTIFHCVAQPPIHRDSIIVSLMGQDIDEIQVSHNMTLNHFQAKIKEKFSLQPSSFIFIPKVFQSKKLCHRNEVTMSAVVEKSTLSLIDSKRRNLPIVDSIPLTLLKYEEIDMFKTMLPELDLLSSNLIYVYEVTGPTIPLTFRTSTSVGSRSEFALISDRAHAVSINLSWSVQTLLKFIEEISHFPCGDISYRGEILPHSSLLSQFFTGCSWKCKGQSCLTQDIPKVVNNT